VGPNAVSGRWIGHKICSCVLDCAPRICMSLRVSTILSALAIFAAGCASPAVPIVRLGGGGRDVLLPISTSTIEGRVPRAATLEGLLRQNQVERDVASSAVEAVRGIFNPRSLKADRSYRLVRTLDGLFREFQYQIDAGSFLRIAFKDHHADGEPQFDVAVEPYPRQVELAAITAEISQAHSSLIGALDAVGGNVQLALSLADIFGGEVDFNSELQRGDRVTVLFERIMRDGQFAGYGDIQGAILENGKRHLTGVRFLGPNGKSAWYDEQGRSLKREFLKSPLPFEPHITSNFSLHRLHPIFGSVRAHLGVDYAAPIGTAVVAVAAGSVEIAAWSGEAGRMVTVKHASGYETSYLHLSAFGPGIHPGAHVTQGQLLGRVGMTGAATGPHLDYRIKKNGIHVNPSVELSRMPPGVPIDSEAMPAFLQERRRVFGTLDQLLGAKAAKTDQ
jgi:murein DD-endopeptidase MepM/ murein hydrolase activator NlpD